MRRKTAFFSPYGYLPLRDAKRNVRVTLSRDAIQKGKKLWPNVCAISLATKENRERFPGVFHGAFTFKTYTIIATTMSTARARQTLQVLRYRHSNELRLRINDFDSKRRGKAKNPPFKPGDVITLEVPRGRDRLGKGHPTSGVGEKKPYRVTGYNQCHKRGVFANQEDAVKAGKEIDDKNIVNFARRAAM